MRTKRQTAYKRLTPSIGCSFKGVLSTDGRILGELIDVFTSIDEIHDHLLLSCNDSTICQYTPCGIIKDLFIVAIQKIC